MVTAYRRTIGIGDLWEQTPELKSENCIPTLEEQWHNEEKKCKRLVTTLYVVTKLLQEELQLYTLLLNHNKRKYCRIEFIYI